MRKSGKSFDAKIWFTNGDDGKDAKAFGSLVEAKWPQIRCHLTYHNVTQPPIGIVKNWEVSFYTYNVPVNQDTFEADLEVMIQQVAPEHSVELKVSHEWHLD